MDAGHKQVYTPHLKKVLKSYQAASSNSLHGPNSVMGVWSEEKGPPPPLTETKKERPGTSKDPDLPFSAPPPFPIQQPPIFTQSDQGRCEKSETTLELETISCFSVGGERRLCLPQILNTVLRDFSLAQINCVCDNLHIFCSRCNSEQLEVLKATGVLPLSAPSCGLITKTDAERLCAALLDSNPPKVVPDPDSKMPFQLRVYHKCFGKCRGLYTPDLYVDPRALCIECTECHGLLSPQKFVCHAHHATENRTCHWGFDSLYWRSYILMETELKDDQQMVEVFSEMKTRFDFNHKYKRKQILAESCDPTKRVRVESYYPYPYTLDPSLIYWYANHPLWNKAFKPLPPVITKDGKPLYLPPEALPTFFKDRFDSHYPSLTPADIQALGLVKVPQDNSVIAYHAKRSEGLSKRHFLRKEIDYDSNSCCFDSEDTFSDTSFSTLSDKKGSQSWSAFKKSTQLPGTEDGLNLEEEEVLPQPENELQSLTKILTENEVDASVHAKIVGEVESLIAKYRKCLSVAEQGKKLYQMELEKMHHTQREKLRKLRETNKSLERQVRRLQQQQQSVGDMAPEPRQIPEDASETMDETECAVDLQQQPEEMATMECGDTNTVPESRQEPSPQPASLPKSSSPTTELK